MPSRRDGARRPRSPRTIYVERSKKEGRVGPAKLAALDAEHEAALAALERSPEGFPIARVEWTKWGQLKIRRCPYCWKPHWHGPPIGPRVPHCLKYDSCAAQYLLVLPENASPPPGFKGRV